MCPLYPLEQTQKPEVIEENPVEAVPVKSEESNEYFAGHTIYYKTGQYEFNYYDVYLDLFISPFLFSLYLINNLYESALISFTVKRAVIFTIGRFNM